MFVRARGPQNRKTYTGKVGGQQDDVCIALQLAMIAQRTFFESSKYASFARQPIAPGVMPG